MIPEITGHIEETLADLRLPFVLIDGVLDGNQGDSVVIEVADTVIVRPDPVPAAS